jgi:uncharacterized protein YqjF (DUF2071 family)
MYQTWSWLSFLHWSYEPAVVQGLLPDGLEVHSFKGRAWVGVTPFFLEDLRTPVAPALPWFTNFPETNVRTYVRGPDGREALWFFSLDAARLEPVLVARSTYALPYMWSEMVVERDGPVVRYRSRRRWPGPTPATSRITVEVGDPLTPEELSEFDHYLTARWQLYTTLGPLLARSNVEHQPVAAAPGCRTRAGREPGRGCRPARPRGRAGGALVARRADQDQRPAPAQTSLSAERFGGRSQASVSSCLCM